MSVLRDSAILVKKSSSGPDGLFLTFMTKASGKVNLYYRRFPRRIRLEFLDPLQTGELLFTPPTEVAPGRLQSFDCEQVWPGVRSDLERLIVALHMANMTVLFTGEGEPAPEVFELLMIFLAHLGGDGNPGTLRVIFELRLLALCGFSPSLDACFSCRQPVSGRKTAFSVKSGGVICDACLRQRNEQVRRLPAGALSFLRRALTLAPSKAQRLRISSSLAECVLSITDDLVGFVLERKPLSSDFIKLFHSI